MSKADTKSFNYSLEDAKALFEPIQVGDFKLDSRVVLAPMTRCRSKEDFSPGPYAVEMYKQRCTAGLLISEASQVSQQGQGNPNTPGIYTQSHVEGWKQITKAVHDQGKQIVIQLWHTGRMSNHFFQPNKEVPVSSSAIAAEDKVFTFEGLQDPEVPRALETKEVEELVQTYKRSAQLAKEANFDGVEVHAAHGYLVNQFLEDGVNKRTDKYGGSIENRCRFLFEILDALLEVWPNSRVAIRISPTGGMFSMSDSNLEALYSHVAQRVDDLKLAYLSISEAHSLFDKEIDENTKKLNCGYFKRKFKSPILSAGGYTPENAIQDIKNRNCDMVAFGRWYISNPDLPERIKIGAPFSKYDREAFYNPMSGAHGYIDYPSLSTQEHSKYAEQFLNKQLTSGETASNGNATNQNQISNGHAKQDGYQDNKQSKNGDQNLENKVKTAMDNLAIKN